MTQKYGAGSSEQRLPLHRGAIGSENRTPGGRKSPAGGILLAMKFAQCFMLTLLRALVSRGTPMTVSTISGSMKVPL